MRWHRLAAIARKEALQIRRDPRSVAIVVAMPFIMMLVFGYGINLDARHLPLYVLDNERSQKSQDLLKHFQASPYFEVVRAVDNYPELVRALDAGRCRVGIVVPADFSRRLAAGATVGVQELIDATDSNTANLIIGYSQGVLHAYSRQIQLDWLRHLGRSGAPASLSVDARTWYSENLDSSDNIVPGVVVIVMAVIGTFLTSLTIAREWERGTMEQLISTPAAPLEIMLGKLAPYFLIGLTDTCLCAIMGGVWFEVPFRGQWSVFLVSSMLFQLVVLSSGYFFSVVAKSQLAASQTSLLVTFLPAFLLSGFVYPIDQMPTFIQVVTRILPARYYMSIIRGVFLKGSTFGTLWHDFAALALLALLIFVLATRAFKKKLT